MSGRKLSFIIALALFSAPIAAGCAQDPTPDPGITKTKEQPQKTDEPKKTEPQADDSGLIPTDDPNVFKATKILPRPAEAANYPKPEYPQLGYESSFEGAEEVAKYFEDILLYSFSTGEYKEFETVCSETSKWCKHMVNTLKANNESASWQSFSNKSEVKVSGYGIPPKERNQGTISIRMEVTLPKREFFDGIKLTKSIKAKNQIRRYVNLDYVGGRWIIVAVHSEDAK